MRAGLGLLTVLILGIGCAPAPAPEPVKPPAPAELRSGWNKHELSDVTFELPPDWIVLDLRDPKVMDGFDEAVRQKRAAPGMRKSIEEMVRSKALRAYAFGPALDGFISNGSVMINPSKAVISPNELEIQVKNSLKSVASKDGVRLRQVEHPNGVWVVSDTTMEMPRKPESLRVASHARTMYFDKRIVTLTFTAPVSTRDVVQHIADLASESVVLR